MYASFLITIWTRRAKIAPPDVLATQRAARAACVAWLIAASVSGGFIDLGLPFFAFAALACVRPSEARTQALEVKAHALPAFNEA